MRERSTPEPRLPCPVCLGIRMEKLTVGGHGDLVVDRCGRCGGAWLDEGEVQALRKSGPGAFDHDADAGTGAGEPAPRMRCRSCDAFVLRDADRCPACDEPVRLDCPGCATPMRVSEHQGLRLDWCPTCRGVWFDRHELRQIWSLSVERVAARGGRRGRVVGPLGEGGTGTAPSPGSVAGGAAEGLTDILFWAPDIAFYGAYAAGHVAADAAGAAAEGLSHLPDLAAGAAEAAGGAVGAAGEVAESAFELILDVIASLFG